MAKKDRSKTGNRRPTESFKNRTLEYTSPEGVSCASGDPPESAALPPVVGTLSNIIRYNHFEVGNGTQSSFSGTDSYGAEIKNATFHEREPLHMRFNYINDVGDYVDGDTNNILDNILSSEYFYDQDTTRETKSKTRIPRYEKQIRPFITYDEEYFQHVYNWSTTHTLKPRNVGGFIQETKVCACDPSGTSTTYIVHPITTTFNGGFTLDKTDSEIYWVQDDWTYRKLNFDAESGEIGGDADGPPSNVNATITFNFSWDDDPSTAGVALNTVGWSGSGVQFKQSGETGSSSETITLTGGDYIMNTSDNQGGFAVKNGGSKIEFYDKDGKDANAQVSISVSGTSGGSVSAKFDSKGNLTIAGTPTNSPATDKDILKEKLGNPVLYHGGTDDNAIFFNYSPENITTDSTNNKSTIVHNFNDPANTTNSLTSSNSNVTITPKAVADLGGGDNSNLRKHYEVEISGVNIASKNDIQLRVESNLSASGLSQAQFSVSRIKLISGTKFAVWFSDHTGTNSFVRQWSVSFGKPATQDFGSTTKLLSIGDTVNGATVTNIVNYVVDVALKRTASESSNKNKSDSRISESKFLSLGATVNDYEDTNGWLHLNATNDLVAGMQVFGDGIKEATKITAVDSNNNIIYISKNVNKQKVKTIKFADSAVNRVSVHTLCYATLSGGSDFTADQTYTSDSNIEIKVRAGKGIVNRSAVVGVYYSSNRKQIEYSPIFYSTDDTCTPEKDSDDNGDWVLGTVRWDNGTKSENQYLMRSPKNKVSYKISSIYYSFTFAPIDRKTFNMFLAQYGSGQNILTLYRNINSYVISALGGKKASSTHDDMCGDQIILDYFKGYEPDIEISTIDESIDTVIKEIDDACLAKFGPEGDLNKNEDDGYLTTDQLKDKLSNIINNSISQSSFMTDDYYKLIVSNEDSLLNGIKKATDTSMKAVPQETEIANLPPAVEGQDNSGSRNNVDSFRALPPSMDRVKYYIEDLIIADDRYMLPNLDLDPATTINQPRIVIRSKPCWNWDGTTGVNPFTVSSGDVTGVINIDVQTDGDGYVSNIISSPGAVTGPPSNLVPGTPGNGLPSDDPGYVAPIAGSGCTNSAAWVTPGDKDDKDNLYVGERSDSFGSGAYYESTNSSLPPELRDLDYIDRNSDDDVNAPSAVIYPRVLWEPNVSYQMDFYKIFWFRLNELTEHIGETLENLGNPYLDTPVRAKITKDITSSATSIKVETTAGFLSNGYLIIPKYTKKIETDENGNNAPYFSYSGEEIVYYSSKSDTSFDNVSRELFNTTSQQLIGGTTSDIETGVRYKITLVGDTEWSKLGGPKDPKFGDVFVATGTGTGTGEVQVFASNLESTPEVSKLISAVDQPKISVISSYERGFSVSQHWIHRLKGT